MILRGAETDTLDSSKSFSKTHASQEQIQNKVFRYVNIILRLLGGKFIKCIAVSWLLVN